MKNKLFALLGIFLLLLVIPSCGGSDDSSDTVDSSAGSIEATEGASVTTPDGSFTFKLSKVYIGEDALTQLSNIGEDPSNFTFNDDPAYKTVLFEYEVNVKSGEFHGEEIGGQLYEADQTAKMDNFLCYELYKNADKDAFGGDVQMSEGDSGTIYAVFGFPSDLSEYYDELLTGEWIHYSL